MRQNLAWAIGYNVIALPIAAAVFEPAFGLVLRPEIALPITTAAKLSTDGSSSHGRTTTTSKPELPSSSAISRG